MIAKQIIKLALVDDHKLFRKGFISLIEMVCNSCNILFEADNGVDLQKKLKNDNLPDIILMDINMPFMDGFAAVEWLNVNFPHIKILILTMIEQEESIVRMFKLGVKGYLGKDVEPGELRRALKTIVNGDCYQANFINSKLNSTFFRR